MKTYRNYPAKNLPKELRVGFADDALVTVTISHWNEDGADDLNMQISPDEVDTEIAKGVEDVRVERFRDFTPENAKDMTAGFKARFKTSE